MRSEKRTSEVSCSYDSTTIGSRAQSFDARVVVSRGARINSITPSVERKNVPEHFEVVVFLQITNGDQLKGFAIEALNI